MSKRKSRKEVRDGFHRELQNHIGLLKREFDKVETVVTHVHRLETNHKGIRALQELRDAKISLLRIRYYQEVDLIAKEFMTRLQDILDGDGLTSNDLMNADDSMDNGNGKDRKQGKRAREDKTDDRKKKVSKKTDDKTTAPRRTPRKGAGKRKEKSDQAPGSDAEQAAVVEQARTFLRRTSEAKKQSDTDCDEAGKPKGQEKLRTKIKIQYTGNTKSLIVERVPSEDHVVPESTASDEDENDLGPTETAGEINEGDQGNDGKTNTDDAPRRSTRTKKETMKMKETKKNRDNRRTRRR